MSHFWFDNVSFVLQNIKHLRSKIVLGWVTYEDYGVMKMVVTHSQNETIPLMAPCKIVEKDSFLPSWSLAWNLSFFWILTFFFFPLINVLILCSCVLVHKDFFLESFWCSHNDEHLKKRYGNNWHRIWMDTRLFPRYLSIYLSR